MLSRSVLRFTLILLLAAPAAAKPRIRILSTGGTIAGAQTQASAPGYQSGAVSIQ